MHAWELHVASGVARRVSLAAAGCAAAPSPHRASATALPIPLCVEGLRLMYRSVESVGTKAAGPVQSLVRIVVGFLFACHGAASLFGWSRRDPRPRWG